MYKTLIIDDERPQQELLSGLIKNYFPGIEVAGICSSVEEGINSIYKLDPQLVFLDVVMPPFTAFDLLERLESRKFDIIFMSSYERYAVNAFKVSAVDYLLKPFGQQELAAALIRFEEKRKLQQAFDHIGMLLNNIRCNTSADIKIALPTHTGFHFVRIGDIVRCEADNNYTFFYLLNNTRLLVCRQIRECEDLLAEYNFFRVHNSHIVNLSMIKEYVRGDGGHIRLADGSKTDVSRGRKDSFLEALQKL